MATNMQKINWGNFKAKFNGKEQASFEWLCYLLFCAEFNRPLGIFRYKNQTGIETEPIEYEGKLIGFQAKFYETRLSENKSDIIDSVTKAKIKNKGLTKILLYVNKEFAESSRKDTKDPKYKTEIEESARSQGVEIQWKVPSHLEIQLARNENKHIAKHFFSLGKSILDLVAELTQHTEAILTPIRSTIPFGSSQIKVERTEIITQLQAVTNRTPFVILTGVAGVGKTAVIKDFYSRIKKNTPCYVFKATEFNVASINQLFVTYGDFTLSDFVTAHTGIDRKYVIIDSAEKLSDIEDTSAFQELLSELLINQWSVVFTTRFSYVRDLGFRFVEVYRVTFESLIIDNLSSRELSNLSIKYDFNLPTNARMLELLQNPFHLGEYLRHYEMLDNAIGCEGFKNTLWDSQIAKTSYRKDNVHHRREECFLGIAFTRATQGHMLVRPDGYDQDILRKLDADDIIRYDPAAGGYFITHDIYEEWALEKIIERAFRQSDNFVRFFREIGHSLPVRRAFRLWLSEQLLAHSNAVQSLIEAALPDDDIEEFWKDEIWVSILLSDHSANFFRVSEAKLLENNQRFLVRLIFLMRIACKDVDEEFLRVLGIKRTSPLALQTLFTRPKGTGWHSMIDFIHTHRVDLGLQHVNIILPMLTDWTSKHKDGSTTKKASKIALFYYHELADKGGVYFHGRDKLTDQTLRVILQGAAEIANELKVMFDHILSHNRIDYRDPYHPMVKRILSSITDSAEVARSLPKYVLTLADLFWSRNPSKNDRDHGFSLDVEKYFGLRNYHGDYYPASAFQTPILLLLSHAPQDTIEFIVSFTNRAIEHYSQSELSDEIEKVTLHVDESKANIQYISNRLWNTYRGTQVSTHLLESIHMALEKWLLATGKTATQEQCERWCLALLRNSKSSSLTAVVTSVVLSQPFKLFRLAVILFGTKQFFLYDTARLVLDQQQKGNLLALRNNFPTRGENELHEDERLMACDDSHRTASLEDLALRYQITKLEGESDEDTRARQEAVWRIIDRHYEELPDRDKETPSDKTWRLYLARMDSRKMTPAVEEVDGQKVIALSPDIDPKLKEYSKRALQKNADRMKYMSLRIWSDSRFKKTPDQYQKYAQYEDDPQLVIAETQAILEGLKDQPNETYYSFNQSIPAYTCAVLIRDMHGRLSAEEMAFCKNIVVEYASAPFKIDKYHYQAADGTEPAITILPELIRHFPQEQSQIESLLLLLLLNPWGAISTFAIRGVFNGLWGINAEAANSIVIAYLLLKPKYDLVTEEVKKENFGKGVYEHSETQIVARFRKKFRKLLIKAVSHRIQFDLLADVDKLDLHTLNTAFELLPVGTVSEDHNRFLSIVFTVFAKRLFTENRHSDDDRLDPTVVSRFLQKLAYFVLSARLDKINEYLRPFIENFQCSQGAADLFQEFISAEDRLNSYEAFWTVWNAFYDKVTELCTNNRMPHYTSHIIHNYLLAWQYWKKDAKKWHSLKDREKLFFRKVAERLGHHPAVLYSLAKILNEIGSDFVDDGVEWISMIVVNNKQLVSADLDTNTVYYLENLLRKYVLTNRREAKTSPRKRRQVLAVLNFLVERGSITGYLLREDLL